MQLVIWEKLNISYYMQSPFITQFLVNPIYFVSLNLCWSFGLCFDLLLGLNLVFIMVVFHAMIMFITWLNNQRAIVRIQKTILIICCCVPLQNMCLWSLQKLNTPIFLFPFFHDFFPSSFPLLFPLSHGFSFLITKLLEIH